jgi:hypothetical protein
MGELLASLKNGGLEITMLNLGADSDSFPEKKFPWDSK